jgi:hypothetical protein
MENVRFFFAALRWGLAARVQRAAYEGHSRPEMGVLSIDKGHFWKEKILTTET